MNTDYILINGFKIKFTELEKIEVDGVEWDGYFDGNELQIVVKQDFNLIKKAVTIIHECVHGMFEFSGYGNKEDNENMTTFLGYTLAKFIADNPSVIEFVQNAFKGIEWKSVREHIPNGTSGASIQTGTISSIDTGGTTVKNVPMLTVEELTDKAQEELRIIKENGGVWSTDCNDPECHCHFINNRTSK